MQFFRGFRFFFSELLCTVAAGIANMFRVIVAEYDVYLVKSKISIKRLCGNFGMKTPPRDYLRDQE